MVTEKPVKTLGRWRDATLKDSPSGPAKAGYHQRPGEHRHDLAPQQGNLVPANRSSTLAYVAIDHL